MIPKTIRKLALIVAAATFSMISCQAATLIQHVSFAGGNNAGIEGTAGTKFTIGATSIVVSALGVQDVRVPSPPPTLEGPPPPTPPPDGLQRSHQVGIWNASGTLLGSITILAGTASTQTDTVWRYENLTQTIVLEAGQTYVLGAHLSQGFDPITDNGLDPYAFALSPVIAGVANVMSLGSFQMPTEVQQGGVPRWAPANLRYELVPEPSAVSLLSAGGLLLASCRRRHH